jgi:hypothetical protein
MAGKITVSTINDSSGVLATQNGMTGIAKAWVNINGASGASPTIRGSFNISSVTRSGTGAYSVSFTTAMANANYSVPCGFKAIDGSTLITAMATPYGFLTSGFSIQGQQTNTNALYDFEIITVAVFSS